MKHLLEKFSSVSIRTKLFALSTIILIASFAVMGYQESVRMKETIQGEALEKAQSDLLTGYTIIDLQYPGSWHVEEGKLYKGETLINDNHSIVDTIGELTNGDTATIFLGDIRVTTNVMVDGERAVGTQVSDDVAAKVLKEGEMYLDQANVVGHTYQAAYMPIKDDGGSVIGIWYVGAPDANERINIITKEIVQDGIVEALIILAIAMLLYFLLTRPIINRITASANSLQIIANGDFAQKEVEVKSNDETGVLMKSVNKVTKDLNTILTQVKDTSHHVAASSEQLMASTEQTSQASEQISTAIQEIALGSEKQLTNLTLANESVSEISRGMDQASQLIQNMADYSATVNDNAKFGTETVTKAIDQMSLVNRTVEETAKVIHILEEKSKEIDEVVEVITQIASQTNLLALNAAIEAARAGEHGKGFAVVADEVRKLADQSGKSADKVSELIGQVQAESYKAVQSMNLGTKVVGQGMEQVNQTGVVFNEIVTAISEISSQSQEVAAIVQEVNANSQEMVSIMGQVSTISQQSSYSTQSVAAYVEEQNASMEEVSTSATNLGHMAEDLKKLIDKFKV
ncbi:methyl-accepting chemotaxis protein [Paenibacillus endoradicis]|uniref:methyl-accepting chemotaxis protein n=1 Tax=Paenibacillus endoradicis TaxID=2972487 RepID=UPI00215913A6|nr:methyl-accepting chemotaxis protein [Paenibacillus endoradicis]MCR8658733.1 methyl-accepting chemotaxis protein [Paenibacillus endoradicis]